MSVINVEHISKLYGDKLVLEDLSCSVDEGDKIGIIGINVLESLHFFGLSQERKKLMRGKLYFLMV